MVDKSRGLMERTQRDTQFVKKKVLTYRGGAC